MLGIEDKNIAGSGNILDANFKVNSENLKYDLNFTNSHWEIHFYQILIPFIIKKMTIPHLLVIRL